MIRLTNDAPDPPINPEWLGWGDPALSTMQNLVVEASMQESLPTIVTALDCRGASRMMGRIHELIRKQFKFDGPGWDMMVAERMVYRFTIGKTLMVNQNMGNCVGNSHCCLVASRIAHEVLAAGDPEEPLGVQQLAIPFMPYSYGVGRLVGGMLGPGDGSYCGAQIEGTMKYGFLPCFVDGLSAAYGGLPQSSADVGRLFGRSKAEIEKWMSKAAAFDLREAPKCRDVDDAWTLIVDKQVPIQICSGTMPTYWKYDEKYGFPLYRMGTPASHSTQLIGMFEHKGARFVTGRNQWGYDAHKGAPEIDVPGGCYVFPAEELAKWLPRAEALGIGEIVGLPSNPGF